jgi:hypothetical protein
MEHISEMAEEDIEMADIARGRRITAVAASDLKYIERRCERPSRKSAQDAFVQRLYRSGHIPPAQPEDAAE